jgi:hypothetical protein
VKLLGDAQDEKTASSRLHWKLEPDSVEEKLKVAEVLTTVPVGPSVMFVSGGVVSGST